MRVHCHTLSHLSAHRAALRPPQAKQEAAEKAANEVRKEAEEAQAARAAEHRAAEQQLEAARADLAAARAALLEYLRQETEATREELLDRLRQDAEAAAKSEDAAYAAVQEAEIAYEAASAKTARLEKALQHVQEEAAGGATVQEALEALERPDSDRAEGVGVEGPTLRKSVAYNAQASHAGSAPTANGSVARAGLVVAVSVLALGAVAVVAHRAWRCGKTGTVDHVEDAFDAPPKQWEAGADQGVQLQCVDTPTGGAGDGGVPSGAGIQI